MIPDVLFISSGEPEPAHGVDSFSSCDTQTDDELAAFPITKIIPLIPAVFNTCDLIPLN